MMHLNRLRMKIFISFVLILAMIGLFVFGLFRSSQDYEPGYQNMAKNAIIVKLILEETGRHNVPKTLTAIGRTGRVTAWVTDWQDRVVASSIDGDIPAEALRLEHTHSWQINEVTLYQIHKGETEAVAAVPMVLGGQKYTLFLSNRLRDKIAPELLFLRGLAPVLLAGVVLMFLVTWFISWPLRGLHNAVSSMAAGNLSARASVVGNDELGDLSRAFNRMAGSLERMIRGSRELMSNVSHQLRTPLTRMRLSLELLRDELERRGSWERSCPEPGPEADPGSGSEPETAPALATVPVPDSAPDAMRGNTSNSAAAPLNENMVVRHLCLLQGEINRMDGLIGQILLFSRLYLKEHPLRPAPCRADSLLTEVTHSFSELLKARDLTFSEDIRELPVALLDVDAMAVALENIMDNAVKYTTRGGEVIVRAAVAESCVSAGKKGGGQVRRVLRLEVSNTAPDMSCEELEGTLKPSYRGGHKAAPGSGLGLPISKKIIEGHGGRLLVDGCAPGFRVIIELPLDGGS